MPEFIFRLALQKLFGRGTREAVSEVAKRLVLENSLKLLGIREDKLKIAGFALAMERAEKIEKSRKGKWGFKAPCDTVGISRARSKRGTAGRYST